MENLANTAKYGGPELPMEQVDDDAVVALLVGAPSVGGCLKI